MHFIQHPGAIRYRLCTPDSDLGASQLINTAGRLANGTNCAATRLALPADHDSHCGSDAVTARFQTSSLRLFGTTLSKGVTLQPSRNILVMQGQHGLQRWHGKAKVRSCVSILDKHRGGRTFEQLMILIWGIASRVSFISSH